MSTVTLDGANVAFLAIIVIVSSVLLYKQLTQQSTLLGAPTTCITESHPVVPSPLPQPAGPKPCASLAEALDGWFSTDPPHQPLLHPDEDTVMPFVTYSPSRCTLLDHRRGPDGAAQANGTTVPPLHFCDALFSKGITFILFVGDSLPANQMVSFQRHFFHREAEISARECWSQRRGSLTDNSIRGNCVEDIHCDGRLRLATWAYDKQDEEGRVAFMRFLLSSAYGPAAREAKAAGRSPLPDAVVSWYGLHNLRSDQETTNTARMFNIQTAILDGLQALALGNLSVGELAAIANAPLSGKLQFLASQGELAGVAGAVLNVAQEVEAGRGGALAAEQQEFLQHPFPLAFRKYVYLGVTFQWLNKKGTQGYSSFQYPHNVYDLSNNFFRACASRGVGFVDMFPFSARATSGFSHDGVHYDGTWNVVLSNALLQWMTLGEDVWSFGGKRGGGGNATTTTEIIRGGDYHAGYGALASPQEALIGPDNMPLTE